MRRKKKQETNEALYCGYDYSTPEAREETAAALFHRARQARAAVERDWERCNDYYNFIHDVTAEIRESGAGRQLPFAPAVMPDPWIIVESQIEPEIPEPEFRGRDSDMDSHKARQREYAVRYIIENNRLRDMNTRNERRLLKYGDAFWKACWDSEMRCGVHEGDIRIRDIPVDCIFPDPAVRSGDIQEGQFLCYVYRMHKVRFAQLYRTELERLGLAAEELFAGAYMDKEGLFDMSTSLDRDDDTVEVLEHWFRQPVSIVQDGQEIEAGAVGCSIQAGGRELRYIPCYWQRTGRQCKLFPFVHYWRTQDENSFWNKSELFPVLDLVDAADRKLAMGLLGDAFLSNDIVLVEEGALAEGEEISNEPGAVLHLKPNRIHAVRRLGGVQSSANAAVAVDWLKEQIERSTRNYETSQGKEPARTMTASGLAMLRSDAGSQADIKKADRDAGFERLYELLDWLALEFFDDGRLIYLGADESRGREAVSFRFSSDALSEQMPAVLDLHGNVVRESWTYWPRLDVTISAGESILRGKKATLEALQSISAAAVTAENWKLFAAQLEILDIPGKQDIINEWKRRFESVVV
ncbi:MAG: hypothetical protein E7442_04095 [Ruminococcaceae bacterium]|nr:hypothetical protein [Oscillospiraceae bacterium]